MRARGLVLLCCLLLLALCSALVLASLQLNRLASQFNQLALDQQQSKVLLQGTAILPSQQVPCLPSGQIWPPGWQQCSLQAGRRSNMTQANIGFVLEITTVVIPQGGGLK